MGTGSDKEQEQKIIIYLNTSGANSFQMQTTLNIVSSSLGTNHNLLYITVV